MKYYTDTPSNIEWCRLPKVPAIFQEGPCIRVAERVLHPHSLSSQQLTWNLTGGPFLKANDPNQDPPNARFHLNWWERNAIPFFGQIEWPSVAGKNIASVRRGCHAGTASRQGSWRRAKRERVLPVRMQTGTSKSISTHASFMSWQLGLALVD